MVADGPGSLVVPSNDSDPMPAAQPAEPERTGPATLDASPRAPSGSELEVLWTGPDNQNDYVAIAVPGDPGNKQEHNSRKNI